MLSLMRGNSISLNWKWACMCFIMVMYNVYIPIVNSLQQDLSLQFMYANFNHLDFVLGLESSIRFYLHWFFNIIYCEKRVINTSFVHHFDTTRQTLKWLDTYKLITSFSVTRRYHRSPTYQIIGGVLLAIRSEEKKTYRKYGTYPILQCWPFNTSLSVLF